MKKRIIITTSILILAAFILGSVGAQAFAQSPVRKLGRGAANTITGFLEVPANIVDVVEEEGPIAAITYGIARGCAMAVLRTAVGVYELVTFALPFPENYEPILEPEFMMGEENY